MNTTYRKNLKDVAIACKNYTEDKIMDLRWELGANDLSISKNTSSAYQKTAPTDTIAGKINKINGNCIKYAPSTASDNTVAYLKSIPTNTYTINVNNLGGMSYKSINLIDTSNLFDIYIDGSGNEVASTTDKTTDYIFVESGVTQVSMSILALTTAPSIAFRVAEYNSNKTFITRQLLYNDIIQGEISSKTFTLNANTKYIRFIFNTSYYGDINTWMGNYGTVKAYQPYYTGIRDSAVTQLTINGTPSTTKSIPAQIQALDGYGWGVNSTCYNYIDYENKKFVQKVGRVDLGSLTYTKYDVEEGNLYRTNGLSSIVKMATLNLLVVGFTPVLRVNRANKTIYSSDILTNTIDIVDNSYSDATAFKTAMNGVYLYYELETPLETDISSYLTDFNPITTNDNYASITFDNTYNNEVPSALDFLGMISEVLCTSITANDTTLALSNNDAKYGWSAGSVRNVRDYDTNKGTQNVNRVKLKDLNFEYLGNYAFAVSNIGIASVNAGTIVNAVCKKYDVVAYNTLANNTSLICISGYSSDRIYLRDTNYTNATALKNHFTDDDYFYFELATPVVEDITPLASQFLNVVGGDVITFANTNNEAVSSEVTFLIEEER